MSEKKEDGLEPTKLQKNSTGLTTTMDGETVAVSVFATEIPLT